MISKFVDRSKTNRLFLSAFIACGITGGLFLVMQTLIRSEGFTPKPSEFRTLSVIVPQIEEPDHLLPRDPAVRIDAPVPPPVVAVANLTSTAVAWEVPVPVSYSPELPRRAVEMFTGISLHLDQVRAEPIRVPVPDYPDRALRQGLSGNCEVRFSIDQMGRPYNTVAECSDKVFVRSAEKAVRGALFAVRTKNGKPVGQDNLVYPLLYELNVD